ncbi:unnamed protein product [Ectocarpus sp. CCAP 1310/34]|nr:unnamed protein product [Ectocarpus sp. CCAP 1310/34]
MGEVPINPTGFAHGFRPLEGDHPPATPTQRNATAASQSVQHAGSFLSAMSQPPTPAGAHGGAVGMGFGPSRKRRRLPGPLAFLQHGAGSAGQQDGGGVSDDDSAQRRLSNDSDPNGGEAGGGHFTKGPWLSLCSAIDAPIAEEGASDSKAVQAFLRGAVSPMSEVLAGDFDLRVPVVTAVIDSYTKLSISDVVVELVDPSGRIKGHLHPGCLEEHGPSLGPGAALLLKEVSIFVSGPATTRLLNVHPDCVLAVFAADTSPPAPSRLEWLTTCDPPFTPQAVPDSGNGRPPPHHPSSRTPPPPTTPTSAATRQRGEGFDRRRPQAPAARRSPVYDQQQMTPRLSPPVRLSPQRLRRQEEDQHGQHQQTRRHLLVDKAKGEQQGRQKPPQPSPNSRNVSQEVGSQSSVLNQGSKDMLPPSPSPSLGGSSPPGMFSQSQSPSPWEHQIALGQHRDDSKEKGQGQGDEGAATAGDTAPFRASAGNNSAAAARAGEDLTGETRDPHVRGPSRGGMSAEDGRMRGRVDFPDPPRERQRDGDSSRAAAPGAGTDQASCVGTPDADHCSNVGGDVEQTRGTSTSATATGSSGATQDGLRRRRTPVPDHGGGSSPEVVVGGLTSSEHSSSVPTPEDERAEGGGGPGGGPQPRRGEEKDHEENVRLKAAGGSSSIWTDLDGLASSDDSSDDEGVSSRSTAFPERHGLAASNGSENIAGQEQPLPQQQPHQQEESVGAEKGNGHRDLEEASALLCSNGPDKPTGSAQGAVPGAEDSNKRNTPTMVSVAPGVELGRAAARRGETLSLFGGGVSNAADAELLDAALDDSE